MFFNNPIPNQQKFQQQGQQIDKEELKNALIKILGQVSTDGKIKTVGEYVANLEILPEYAQVIDIFYNMLTTQLGTIGVDVTKYYLADVESLEKDMEPSYKKFSENMLDNSKTSKQVSETILKTLAYLSKQIHYKIINKQYKDEVDKSVEVKVYGENAFVLAMMSSALHSELYQAASQENEDSPVKKDLNLLASITDNRMVAEDQKLKFNTPFGPLILTFMILYQNYRLLAEQDNAIDYIDANEFGEKLKAAL